MATEAACGSGLARPSYLRPQTSDNMLVDGGHRPDDGVLIPLHAGTALTDTDSRPSPAENHLLITAYSTHPESPLLSVTRRISDSGCNLVDTRLATVGRDVSLTALATGSWDAVAKLETMLGRLEREEAGMRVNFYRTQAKPQQSNLLPYIVEVVAADKPGILYQLADFFNRQGITIESLQSTI